MENMTKEMLALLFSTVYLAMNSAVDIYKKKISFLLVGSYLILWLCLFMSAFIKDGTLFSKILGMLPGVLLILLSMASRGAIGLGDGILMIPVGLYLGLRDVVLLLLLAFSMAFLWSVVLLCLGKKKKTYTFPFVPFLFLGVIGVWIW